MLASIQVWWSCAVEAGRRIPDAFSGIDVGRIGDLTVGEFLRASGPGGAVAFVFLVLGLFVSLWKLPRINEGGLTPARTAFLAGFVAFIAGAIGMFATFFSAVYREKTAEAAATATAPAVPPPPIDTTVAIIPALEGALALLACFVAMILLFRFRRSLRKPA
ncbi:MAG: hypothetical protein JXP34_03530 [Planctomycetes bacterium]|nr:hypothetical protein [Planctomycetota bacterium]